MKFNLAHETDISRRNLLRSGPAGLLGLLLNSSARAGHAISGAVGLATASASGASYSSRSVLARVMPELSLPASDGRPVMEAAGRWRAIYIDFWASWCGPCKLSFPWMNDMHEELAPLGLRIVGISLDRRESDALRFVEQVPTRFPIAMDPQAAAAKQFEVKAMPSAYLLRPNRELLYEHRGFRLEDRRMLERQLRSAIA